MRQAVEPEIDAALVARLIADQFPQWANLAVRSVEFGGWDNRTFRLGDELSVRLPSAAHYANQVDVEHRWLPVLPPSCRTPYRRPSRAASRAPATPIRGPSGAGSKASRRPSRTPAISSR